MSLCTRVQYPQKPEEGSDSLPMGVTGGCESPALGARNSIQYTILTVSHLSSPLLSLSNEPTPPDLTSNQILGDVT